MYNRIVSRHIKRPKKRIHRVSLLIEAPFGRRQLFF
jgi:hypothetical protein